MFGKKTQNTIITDSNNTQESGVPPTQPLIVHTMKSDMKEGIVQQPQQSGAQQGVTLHEKDVSQQAQQQGSSRQSSTQQSPFLQDNVDAQKSGISTQQTQTTVPIRNGQATQQQQVRSPQGVTPSSPPKSRKIIIIWIVIIILILAIGGAVVFAWRVGIIDNIMDRFVRQETHVITHDGDNMQDSASLIAGDMNGADYEKETSVVATQPYDHDDRYLPADTAIKITKQATIADVIEKIKDVVRTHTIPITIDVLGEDGEPMPFAVFIKRFLPDMPASVLTELDQPLQIHVFLDNGERRIGIHTYSSDPDNTRSNLREAEPLLIKGFKPIYLFSPPLQKDNVFEDAVHESGVPIRFHNFVQDATQSIDYAIHYSHVFFGTSRATMHAMMNLVFAHDDIVRKNKEAVDMTQTTPSVTVAPATGNGDSGNVTDMQNGSAETSGAHVPPPGAEPGWQP